MAQYETIWTKKHDSKRRQVGWNILLYKTGRQHFVSNQNKYMTKRNNNTQANIQKGR